MVNILKVKIVSTSITWWGIDTASYRWKSENESRSVVSDSLWPPWNSPGQNTGVGSLSLLQGIFPTQGSNPGVLNCRQILYQLSHPFGKERGVQRNFKGWVQQPRSCRHPTAADLLRHIVLVLRAACLKQPGVSLLVYLTQQTLIPC